MPVLELSRDGAPAWRARALVFEDRASRALMARIEQVAPSDATILITGETGTGKEIVARCVHELSARRSAPFLPVNCGAFPATLVESELFGHERGAFTGAMASKPGWFEAADGGTLFLDEVGDLPLATQVKLLRVLQEQEVVRIGGRKAIPIHVRVVAATNVNLREAVAAGLFREDLYYRIHVAPLSIPPLRDRPADILPLARHFLRVHAAKMGVPPPELSDDALVLLTSHSWAGNIRELENAMQQALLVARSGRVLASDLELLPPSVRRPLPARELSTSTSAPEMLSAPPDDRTCMMGALESAVAALIDVEPPNLHREIERVVFRAAYEASERNQLRTARMLGLSRNVVRARLLEHGLVDAPQRRRPQPVRRADTADT